MAAAWGVASALGWEELGEIHTREDPIAESDAAGRSSTKTTLSIVGAIDQRIEIDDLSEANAERLKRLLAESTAQPGT